MSNHIPYTGRIGVISRNGTLTYETIYQLTRLGIGQSICVGFGGNPIISKYFNKPVLGCVAGQRAPADTRLGYAGVIISQGRGDAPRKINRMKTAGVKVIDSPADIGEVMREILEESF